MRGDFVGWNGLPDSLAGVGTEKPVPPYAAGAIDDCRLPAGMTGGTL